LNVLHNYFNSPIKLFSDLYPAKILDILAKMFFFAKRRIILFVTEGEVADHRQEIAIAGAGIPTAAL